MFRTHAARDATPGAAPPRGGGNRSLLTLWSNLEPEGAMPVAVCPHEGRLVGECRDLGVPCRVVEYTQPEWRRPLASWHGYRRWQRLLGDVRVDLVHANDLRSARSICAAAKRTGLPLVCHVRYPPGPGEAGWTFRGLPKPDVFLFNSRSLHAQAGPDLARACPGSRQLVVHNAVDLDEFRPGPRPGGAPPRVGVVANLLPIKGHEDFLVMARPLLDRGCSCEFWIAGSDITQSGYHQHLVQRAAELELNGCLRFLGFQRDVASILNQLDVLVSSSHYEPFGRSLIEAMACGRPVVATRVGGVPEIVEDGKTGILVPPRSPDALAGAIETLLRGGSDRRQAMGRAGGARVEALFGGESQARQSVTVYQGLLHGDTPC